VRWPSERHALRAQSEVRDRSAVCPSHESGLVVAGLPTHPASLGQVHLRRLGPGLYQNRGPLVIHECLTTTPQLVAVPFPHDAVDGLFPDGGLGLCVLDLPRLVVEAALHCPVTGLMAADALLRRGLTSRSGLAEWAACLQRREGVARLAAVLHLVDVRHESPGESRVTWVAHGLGYRLEPQVPVMTRRGPRRLDAMLEGEWVALEHDGEVKYVAGPQDTTRNDALLREKVREDDVRDLGVEFVRVSKEMLDTPALLLERVERARVRARRRHGPARRRAGRI